ncbi:MAG: hypothetical protein SGPRY_001105, partial [Prymnesium sp.]
MQAVARMDEDSDVEESDAQRTGEDESDEEEGSTGEEGEVEKESGEDDVPTPPRAPPVAELASPDANEALRPLV